MESMNLSVHDYAMIEGISPSSARRRLSSRRVPGAERVGGRWRIPAAAYFEAKRKSHESWRDRFKAAIAARLILEAA